VVIGADHPWTVAARPKGPQALLSGAPLRQRRPPGLGDPDPDDFDGSPGRVNALGLRRREPGIDQVGDESGAQAVGEQERLGLAVGGVGQQLQGAAVPGDEFRHLEKVARNRDQRTPSLP
jgi:hypothetical protein